MNRGSRNQQSKSDAESRDVVKPSCAPSALTSMTPIGAASWLASSATVKAFPLPPDHLYAHLTSLDPHSIPRLPHRIHAVLQHTPESLHTQQSTRCRGQVSGQRDHPARYGGAANAVAGFKKNVNRATTQVMMKTGRITSQELRQRDIRLTLGARACRENQRSRL